jgi:hypothetical protein
VLNIQVAAGTVLSYGSGIMAKLKRSRTVPAESSSSMWKLRAIIASALLASKNARLRPGQKRGPAPNTSGFEAVACLLQANDPGSNSLAGLPATEAAG